MSTTRWTPLMSRIATGKAIGLAIGIVGFLLMPILAPETALTVRIGILLWYATIGAVIGVFGVVDFHPVLRLPMPWWVRAPLITAWFNVLLSLFAYPTLAPVVAGVWPWQGFTAFVLGATVEGLIVGLVIGYAATRWFGEGPTIVDSTPSIQR